ncbi:MAG: hypothetical protein U5M51_02225 [Emticicia sp.]|nr:hypothetical protein [Emticicia sp.]
MEEPFYNFRILNDALRFEFESIGKRKLKKVILFSDTTIPNLYQLSLADINEDGSLDFLNVSNNNDRNTILATVFQTTSIFLTIIQKHSLALLEVLRKELDYIRLLSQGNFPNYQNVLLSED